jgi:hypothetical protein
VAPAANPRLPYLLVIDADALPIVSGPVMPVAPILLLCPVSLSRSTLGKGNTTS